MNSRKRPLGYTIVEVMIVLAVSGVMFGVAIRFIDGKQAKTSFTQGANETASRVQAVINDITDGHYSGVNFNCTKTATGISVSVGGDSQGTHNDCVFLGKMMHFREGTADLTHYEIFSLAGARVRVVSGVTVLVTSLPLASQKVIDALTTQEIVPQNLDIEDVKVRPVGGGLLTVFGIGFVQGLGTSATTVPGDLTYASGAQTISMVYSPILDKKPTAAAKATIETLTTPTTGLVAAKKACIYLTDGVRHATVILGGSGSQLNVDIKMSTVAC